MTPTTTTNRPAIDPARLAYRLTSLADLLDDPGISERSRIRVVRGVLSLIVDELRGEASNAADADSTVLNGLTDAAAELIAMGM